MPVYTLLLGTLLPRQVRSTVVESLLARSLAACMRAVKGRGGPVLAQAGAAPVVSRRKNILEYAV